MTLTGTPPLRACHPGPVIGSLCSGYGGLDIAVLSVLGGRLAWVAENDRHAAAILAARFPEAANLGDITVTDWAQVPPVDVLTAGFPCQDISCAGKRAGLTEGTRSVIWVHVAEAVRVLHPRLVVVENVAALRTRGLDRVLGDLAEAGYDALWRCVRASDVGAPHRRERLFLLAWPGAGPADLLRGPGRGSDQDPPPAAHPGGGADQLHGNRPGDPAGGRARNRPGRHRGPTPRHPGQPATATAGAGIPDENSGRGTAAHPDRAPDLADAAGAHGLEAAQWQDAAVRLAGRCWLASRPTGAGPGLAFTLPRRLARPLPADPAGRPPARTGPDGRPESREPAAVVDWGPYESAIRQWESALGLPAPVPTEPAPRNGRRLRTEFVEWIMGLVPGFVSDLEHVPRAAQLRALGNGVVPQQASYAVALLLADLSELVGPGTWEAAA
jgi:DNA (cytosine-5)-methyltransferase 1